MSYVFSRRSFLKYTALTAVAVAGASMLSGCEVSDPNNPISMKFPSSLEILQTKGTMKDIDLTNGVFDFEIFTELDNGLRIDGSRFSVKVSRPTGENTPAVVVYFEQECDLAYPDGPSTANPLLKKDKLLKLKITAPDFVTLQPGDTLLFKYIPVEENREMSMNWQITVPSSDS